MIYPVCQTIIEKDHEGYCPDCLKAIENDDSNEEEEL